MFTVQDRIEKHPWHDDDSYETEVWIVHADTATDEVVKHAESKGWLVWMSGDRGPDRAVVVYRKMNICDWRKIHPGYTEMAKWASDCKGHLPWDSNFPKVHFKFCPYCAKKIRFPQ